MGNGWIYVKIDGGRKSLVVWRRECCGGGMVCTWYSRVELQKMLELLKETVLWMLKVSASSVTRVMAKSG